MTDGRIVTNVSHVLDIIANGLKKKWVGDTKQMKKMVLHLSTPCKTCRNDYPIRNKSKIECF